jgi:hypothetical protein
MSPEDAQRQIEEAMVAMPPELQKVVRDLQQQAKERPFRPRLARLDGTTLSAIPPDDLDSSLVAYVYDRLDGKLGPPVSLTSLSRGLQVFFLSHLVEAEVMNGGFNQFFWNSSSQYSDLVPAALRELKADEAALIFERAQVVSVNEDEMRARLKSERTLEAFSQSYKETHLDAFDAPFCKLAEGFSALRAELVKQRSSLFAS